jgi:nitroimidazol reductase NimA-like FMN-containing flavoprotein (pyridoxamine 5'-phosphate oxidase superfamily)
MAPDEQAAVEAAARAIVDDNLYLVLGTADEAGHPWVSPVYFAPVGYTELVWVSRPGAQHSRNLAVRPEVSLVIFDSTAPINTGQAVYGVGHAEEVPGNEVPRLLEVFSRRTQEHGDEPFPADRVGRSGHLRLYRAVTTQLWALDANDQRIPINL